MRDVYLDRPSTPQCWPRERVYSFRISRPQCNSTVTSQQQLAYVIKGLGRCI